MLLSGIHDTSLNGMAADGERLYVAQSEKPLLWSVPVVGGDGSDYPGSVTASTPLPLLPADGGIYFDAFGDSSNFTWASGALLFRSHSKLSRFCDPPFHSHRAHRHLVAALHVP